MEAALQKKKEKKSAFQKSLEERYNGRFVLIKTINKMKINVFFLFYIYVYPLACDG